MLRPSARAVLRPQLPRYQILAQRASPLSRRSISFAPPSEKPRSFKNFLARCAIAGGGVWWFMNTDVFAEEGSLARKQKPITYEENEQLPTIEEVAESRKQRRAAIAASASSSATAAQPATGTSAETTTTADAAADLEEEAGEQGAFNEETGEINWDCPCLGGMAHGPCGPEFREAFSCFVYSKEDPKGVDCIDRFKNMQDCFRQHPDVYGAELTDDVDDGEEAAAAAADLQLQEQDASALPAASAPGAEATESSTTTPASTAETPLRTSSPPSTSHPTSVAVREKPEEARAKQFKTKEQAGSTPVQTAAPAASSSNDSSKA